MDKQFNDEKLEKKFNDMPGATKSRIRKLAEEKGVSVEVIMQQRESGEIPTRKKTPMTKEEKVAGKAKWYQKNREEVKNKKLSEYHDKIQILREEGGDEAVKKFNQKRGKKYRDARDSNPEKREEYLNKGMLMYSKKMENAEQREKLQEYKSEKYQKLREELESDPVKKQQHLDRSRINNQNYRKRKKNLNQIIEESNEESSSVYSQSSRSKKSSISPDKQNTPPRNCKTTDKIQMYYSSSSDSEDGNFFEEESNLSRPILHGLIRKNSIDIG